MTYSDDFAWIKSRMDDMGRKFDDEQDSNWKKIKALYAALEKIEKIDPDSHQGAVARIALSENNLWS